MEPVARHNLEATSPGASAGPAALGAGAAATALAEHPACPASPQPSQPASGAHDTGTKQGVQDSPDHKEHLATQQAAPTVHSRSEHTIEHATNSSTEAVPDASTEAVPDASTEAMPDASTEAVLDASTEAVLDASTEAVLDATTEAVPDASTEAVPDASTGQGSQDYGESGRTPGGPQGGVEAYFVKTVAWHGTPTPILMQNENGPCPLLALCNVLLLRGRLALGPDQGVVGADTLLALLAGLLLDTRPTDTAGGEVGANYEQNVADALATLGTLQRGMDLNVRFTGVGHMEYTASLAVFDLLNINLYHGWLVPPTHPAAPALATMTYNQCVELVMASRDGPAGSEAALAQGLAIEEFLQETASQLTSEGLDALGGTLGEGELAVLFRNNHFLTVTRHVNTIYMLATDQGFMLEPVMWEALGSIDGRSNTFVDGHFVPYEAAGDMQPPPHEQHVDAAHDLDYQLALQLQAEEDRHTASRAQPSSPVCIHEPAREQGQPPGAGEGAKEGKGSTCSLM